MTSRLATFYRILSLTLIIAFIWDPFVILASNEEAPKTTLLEDVPAEDERPEENIPIEEASSEEKIPSPPLELNDISPEDSTNETYATEENIQEEVDKDLIEKVEEEVPVENFILEEEEVEVEAQTGLEKIDSSQNSMITEPTNDSDSKESEQEQSQVPHTIPPEDSPVTPIAEKQFPEAYKPLELQTSTPVIIEPTNETEPETKPESQEIVPLESSANHIRINELLPNPKGTDSGNEFIELYNYSNEDINLLGWTLSDESGKSTYTFEDFLFPKDSYVTLYNKTDFSFSLNNSSDTVTLSQPDEKIIDTLGYSTQKEDFSWNSADAPYQEKPTPNAPNNPDPATITYPQLILTEILPNPVGEESTDEYIEIYNPTDITISLSGWTVKDASTSGKYTFSDNFIIGPQSYLVIYRKEYGFALNNSGEEVVTLSSPNEKVKSSFAYTSTTEGYSHAWDGSYWKETPLLTPGSKNLFPPPKEYISHLPLLLNELLPNPVGEESTNEYIEIYNPHHSPLSLKGWTVKDASKTGAYTFPEDLIIPAQSYHVIYRNTFSFALNNSGEETVSLLDPNNIITDTVTYNSAKEGASYGRSATAWRWTKTLTPNAENIFGEQLAIQKIDIDTTVYTHVAASFSLTPPSANLQAYTYRWDFGDGHRSYLQDTTHTFDAPGDYLIEARLSNEIESVTHYIKLSVIDYPKRDLEIIEIMPNPDGKDYDTEYIIIRNNENGGVNFSQWSIATGKDDDHLVNHPVREKIIISHDTTKKIRSHHSAISLQNKGGYIELRAPNGKVVDTLEYSLPNGKKSIPKNAIYKKVGKKWQWILPPEKPKTSPMLSQEKTQSIITLAQKNTYTKQTHPLQLSPSHPLAPLSNTPRISTIFSEINHLFTKFLHTVTPTVHAKHSSIEMKKPTFSHNTSLCTQLNNQFTLSAGLSQALCTSTPSKNELEKGF